jgi:hypothetical protein
MAKKKIVEMDEKDGHISELRRLLSSLLSRYVDACRQDQFYDIAHDTLAERCQRVLDGDRVGLSAEFTLMRKVCRKGVRFSRAVLADDDHDGLEGLFEALEVWESFMKKQGYTLK